MRLRGGRLPGSITERTISVAGCWRLDYFFFANDHVAIQPAAQQICKKMAHAELMDFPNVLKLARFLASIWTVKCGAFGKRRRWSRL